MTIVNGHLRMEVAAGKITGGDLFYLAPIAPDFHLLGPSSDHDLVAGVMFKM